jgi:hypothetical protein
MGMQQELSSPFHILLPVRYTMPCVHKSTIITGWTRQYYAGEKAWDDGPVIGRVNISLFGICPVMDTRLVYSKCKETEEKQWEFYKLLTPEEMIDNQHDQVHGHWSLETTNLIGSPKLMANGHMQSGISTAHLAPTKRKTNEGTNTTYM